jgi:hypothetical protein
MLYSCTYPSRQNFDRAIIPAEPRNMREVNSIYDDFNSTLWRTSAQDHFNLAFSTNRGSRGAQFDLVLYQCDLFIDLLDLQTQFQTYPDEWGVIFSYTDSLHNYRECSLDDINTTFNELGPCVLLVDVAESQIVPGEQSGISTKIESHRRLLYASDSTGNLDIYCYYYHEYFLENRILSGHKGLSGINSPFNEAYPTLMTLPAGREALFFTSDRGGNYDIFSAVPLDRDLVDQATAFDIARVQSLSSGADDKCPCVDGSLMVFASNREGGYGGFDLYCSVYDGNNWSEPVNLGPGINTPYDEYRPVHFRMDERQFLSHLLLFSSNRPVGEGGFDLYYAGMEK